MGETRDSAAGSAVFLTLLAAVSQVLAFGYRVILSRMVGAEVMGLYQLLMSAYAVLLSLCSVGLTACASNLSAHYLALGNGRGMEGTRRLCLSLLGAGSAALGLTVLLLYDPISVFLLGDARTQLGLVLLMPCVLLTGVENLHKHIFYGAGLVRPPAFVELAEQGIRAGAVLGLLALFLPQNPERTVGLIVVGMVVCEVFSSTMLTVLYRRRFVLQRGQGRGETKRILLGRIAGIALPVSAASLLGNLMGAANAALIPRKLVEGGMTRADAMSEFGVICGMTMPMLTLPTVFLGALNLVMIPRLARAAALGRPEQVRSQIRRVLGVVSVLILPAMAMMAVVGGDLAVLLFAQPEAGEHLVTLAAATVFASYRGILGGVLNGIGKQGRAALVSLLCDGVQLAFVFAVPLPGVGIGGFAVGTLVSELLGAALCARYVMTAVRVRLPIFQSLTAPALSALLMGLTSNLLLRWLKNSGISPGMAGMLVLVYGTLLYLAALQAQGVSLKALLRGTDQ